MSKEIIYDENEDGWSYSFPSSLDNLQDTLIDSKAPDEISIPSDTEEDKEKNHAEVPPVDIKESSILLEVTDDSFAKNSVKVTKRNGSNGHRRLARLNEKNGSYSSSTSSLAPSFLVKPSPAADPFLSKPPIQLQRYDDIDFEERSIIEDDEHSINSPSIRTGTTLTSPTTPKSRNSNGEPEKSVAKEQLKSLNIDQPIPEESTVENNGITATSPDMLSYRKSSRKKTVTSISSVDDVAPPSPNDTRTSTRDSFDRSLYADELYLDTRYRYATPERNTAFHDLFKNIPLDDRFLDDFSCALSREILVQGRIYVSERHICFNANILGWVTNLEIPHQDIVSFEKRTTAGIFPNGIVINLKDTKHSFLSFISRDSIFNFFETIWSKSVSKIQLENENSDVIPHALTHYSRDMASEDQERINNIILSIDTDEEAENQQLQKVRVVRAKEKSEYKSDGPETHVPTSADIDLSNETVLCEDILNAPIGLTFNILFGENIKFHQFLMDKSDGFDFTSYGEFVNNKRGFEYQKSLGYSIGPKSTKCVVKESIEHFDYDSYIMVLTETKSPDVPSGGSFSVNTRYIFTWAKGNKTKLTLSYFINWTGSSWIKSMIEKSTAQGQKSFSELLFKQLKLVIAENTLVVAGDEEVPVTFSQEQVEEPEKATEKVQHSEKSVTETTESSKFDVWHLLVLLLIVLQILTYRELLATKQEMKLLAQSLSTKK
ncbi:Putative sterol transfer protein [Komagataella phaffii CBS 7435]|uniref:Protein involved in programmed cell death n=2 Tax=Komagataella phaffii TaxID=460519 RepID=C4QW28_KOMPG|nr:Protein involved in programmed cell death [Komagataella phaffii GS115]AOA61464.1 GQ67_02660T0 [Komagataella phaffii]CAH2446117.1 Putative sterol transfer protein [Komagataella phaffii CBS 7435]AOA66319.1 GQ68_02588T0 [Komagataella phaffii GS115]CAY67451.1 Protein involved in programmed cell death [Komagataella phaffii GS115]CCA36550.1 Putative sterol transfer protein [Komagataella phaffii CBS 7435]